MHTIMNSFRLSERAVIVYAVRVDMVVCGMGVGTVKDCGANQNAQDDFSWFAAAMRRHKNRKGFMELRERRKVWRTMFAASTTL